MVSVRATGSGDWELVRDVRLAALRDAPDAFASQAIDRASPRDHFGFGGRIQVAGRLVQQQ